MDWSRRRVLQGLAACSGLSLAGCTQSETLTGMLGTEYRTWLPDPEQVAWATNYDVLSVRLPNVDGGVVAEPVRSRLTGLAAAGIDQLGIDPGTVEAIHRVGYGGAVVVGELDETAIRERLGTRAERRGTHGDYAVFSDGATAYAVGPTAVVMGPTTATTPGQFLAPILDARNGDGTRYHSVNGALAALTDALGTGDVVLCCPADSETAIDSVEASGIAWRVTDQGAKTTLGVVFTDGDAVSIEAIERLTQRPAFDAFEQIDIGKRGRVGLLTATVDRLTERALAPTPTFERVLSTAPTATFDFEFGQPDDAVTITHAGGDAIPQSRLLVRGPGIRTVPGVDQTEPGRWRGDTARSGVVAPGDQVTVGAAGPLRIEYDPLGQAGTIALASGAP